MIPREQLEQWKTLHKPTLVFLGEVCEAVPALIAEVEAQAKENERLRAALGHVLHDDHVPDCSAWKCAPPLPPSGGHECSCPMKWARGALKEGT